MEVNQGQTAAPAAPAAQTNSAPQGNSTASVRSNVNAAKARMFGGGPKEPDQPQGASTVQHEPGTATAEVTSASPEGTSTKQANKPQAQQTGRSPKDAQAIKKLVAQRYQLKGQVDALQAEIAELRKLQSNAPKQEDFTDAAEFQSAQIEHNLEVKQASKEITAKQAQVQHQHHAEWTQRCQETVRDFGEFAPRYQHYLPQMQKSEPEILEAVAASAIGPRLLEEAFTDLFEVDENYARWQAMSPHAKRSALAQIEAKILREEFNGRPTQAQPQVQKSSAPAPILPESTPNAGQPSAPRSSRGRIEAAKRRMFAG